MTASEAGNRSGMAAKSTSPARVDNVSAGLLLMAISVFIAPLIDIFSKLAAGTVPTAEVSLFRFIFQSFLMLPFVIWRGTWREFSWSLTKFHALRGGILAISMICFVTTLKYMEVADAIAIFFVEPIILTIMGGVLLKETIGWRRYTACLVGFLGAMVIIRPSFQEIGWIALLPIVTAFGIAVFALLTRVLSHREDPWSMQFQTGIWGGIFCALVLVAGYGSGSDLFDPVMPDGLGLLYCFGCGVMATTSGIIAVYAYRNAPASTLAPLQYFEIVCATLFGWLVFGDFPDAMKWLGIGIIIASGLFILWREKVVARQRLAASRPEENFAP